MSAGTGSVESVQPKQALLYQSYMYECYTTGKACIACYMEGLHCMLHGRPALHATWKACIACYREGLHCTLQGSPAVYAVYATGKPCSAVHATGNACNLKAITLAC